MPISPQQNVPMDERPAVVNFVLAAWAGLMTAAVISAGGFDAADPLRNGWVRLAGLGVTAGLLGLAFRSRTEGAARRLQLGVGLSLVMHTLGALGLSSVSLRTQADPLAEPAAPPLVKQAREFQPRLAPTPEEDAPPRPEFERPLATAETPTQTAVNTSRSVTPTPLAIATPPTAEAALLVPPTPVELDPLELGAEASPTVAATDYERIGPEADFSALSNAATPELVAEEPEAAAESPPLLAASQLKRERLRGLLADLSPVTSPLPITRPAAPPVPRTTVSASSMNEPVITPTPRNSALRGPVGARAASAPLVDVAPLEFEPARSTGVNTVQSLPSITRPRVAVNTPEQSSALAPAYLPPTAQRERTTNGPTNRPDGRSDQTPPPLGELPRIALAPPRDRVTVRPPSALAALPDLVRPPTDQETPATDPRPAPELRNPPPPSLLRPRPTVDGSARSSPEIGIVPEPERQRVSAPIPGSNAATGTDPRLSISSGSPRVASVPRHRRAPTLPPATLGVSPNPIALPPKVRAPAPAFASRLRPSATEPANAPKNDATGISDRVAAASGAPPRTEAAIELGLQFLAGSQRPDGSWSFRDQVEPGGRSGTARASGAATGLALLALLGAGCDHYHTQHGPVVQRGLDYLIDRQRRDGLLFPELGARPDNAVTIDAATDAAAINDVWPVSRFYGHGIAAIALCEAFGMTGDAQLRAPAQRALDYLEATQVKRLGGWRYTPGVNTDLSVTGWQLMALRSGELAGLDVSPEAYAGVRRFVESCRERSGRRVRFCYNPTAPSNDPRTSHGRRPGTVMTAVGLLSMLYLGDNPRAARMQLGANHLLDHLPTGDPSPEGTRVARISTIGSPLRDTYYWYYATQVMYHMGGDYWRAWNDALHPLLVDTQVREGGLAGSWNPYQPLPDRWSHFGGRHYVTTMNLLSLEVYYRHLPLYGRVGE